MNALTGPEIKEAIGAMHTHGKLLIGEKHYMFPALRTSSSSIEAKNDQNAERGNHIKMLSTTSLKKYWKMEAMWNL
jgi:hypothetical protein